MPWKAAQQACTYVAKRPGGRSSSIPTGRCGRWLRACWAGPQIARTLKRMWPQDSELHVSHETIYNTIYAHPKGELRKALLACLCQDRSIRRPRSAGQDRRGQIPKMVSIHVRPPEVADRLMPGHWEW